MIIICNAPRKSGKTRYSLNNIFAKQKEGNAYFICSGLESEKNKRSVSKNLQKFINPASETLFRGRDIDTIVCDEYCMFGYEFKKSLFKAYKYKRVKNIYIFGTGLGSTFKEDVYNLDESIHIKCSDLYNDFDSEIKKQIVNKRFNQTKNEQRRVYSILE